MTDNGGGGECVVGLRVRGDKRPSSPLKSKHGLCRSVWPRQGPKSSPFGTRLAELRAVTPKPPPRRRRQN